MSDQNEPTETSYPIGRGYGHDYMRGGEVLGGYGYSEREEYERRRGENGEYTGEERRASVDQPPEGGESGGIELS